VPLKVSEVNLEYYLQGLYYLFVLHTIERITIYTMVLVAIEQKATKPGAYLQFVMPYSAI